MYGGPAAGAAAAKLTGPLIDGLAGKDGPKVAEAARAAAAGDPKMEQAVATAERAVANTTAAYHLVATAADAADGDKEARGRIVELVRAAKTGDRAADSALGAIADAFEVAIAKRAQEDADAGAGAGQATTESRTAPGGADLASMFSSFAQGGAGGAGQVNDYGDPMPPEVTASGAWVGADAVSLLEIRAEASEAAQAIAEHGALFVGYVKTAGGRDVQGEHGTVTMTDSALTTTFDDVDDADAWLGSLAPSQIVYAAYFDTSDPTFPARRTRSSAARSARAGARAGRVVRPRAAVDARRLRCGMGGALLWKKYRKPNARDTVTAADQVISGALAPMLAFGLGAGPARGRRCSTAMCAPSSSQGRPSRPRRTPATRRR